MPPPNYPPPAVDWPAWTSSAWRRFLRLTRLNSVPVERFHEHDPRHQCCCKSCACTARDAVILISAFEIFFLAFLTIGYWAAFFISSTNLKILCVAVALTVLLVTVVLAMIGALRRYYYFILPRMTIQGVTVISITLFLLVWNIIEAGRGATEVHVNVTFTASNKKNLTQRLGAEGFREGVYDTFIDLSALNNTLIIIALVQTWFFLIYLAATRYCWEYARHQAWVATTDLDTAATPSHVVTQPRRQTPVRELNSESVEPFLPPPSVQPSALPIDSEPSAPPPHYDDLPPSYDQVIQKG